MVTRWLFVVTAFALAVATLAANCHDPVCNPFSDNCTTGGSGAPPSLPIVPTPDPSNPPPPPPTRARYMDTADPATAYNMGCDQGGRLEAGVVILAFGMPQFVAGQWGAEAYRPVFESLARISDAAYNFANGYYYCSRFFGYTPLITLAVGTTNEDNVAWTTTTEYQHGYQWALMVKDLSSRVQAGGFSTGVVIYAGDDIETQWQTPAKTRAWIDGYTSLSGGRPYINFGSAAGCPQSGTAINVNLDCATDTGTGWKQDDVWYVTWAPALGFVVPEIYLTDVNLSNPALAAANSHQWQQLSLYGRLNHGSQGLIRISGSLTQHGACHSPGHSCLPTEDNEPGWGWSQLWRALYADPITRQSSLPWSNDITWVNSP